MAVQHKFTGHAEYSKGLDGVIACESKIGYVDGDQGWLIYGGIDIEDLAALSNYEESACLALYGRLPTQAELDDFKKKLLAARAVPGEVFDILKKLPKNAHTMAWLRTGFSALGCFVPNIDDFDLKYWTEVGINQIAQMATVAAAVGRIRKGLEPVDPDPSLDHAANFLWMLNGKKPSAEEAKVMDVNLILHLDHEMNASTFTSMSTISSLSDMYSAVVSGIGSLKGPLHGGANEQVIKMLLEIGDPAKAEGYVKDKMAKKQKIMGFGHRVYKAYDPRARILRQYAEKWAKEKGLYYLFESADIVEKTVIEALGKKGIFPNVDFYSGIVYYAMGIETDMFTPIFAVSRIAGWVARNLEYVADNRIFRPRALYTGPLKTDYVPIEQRELVHA